MNYTQFYKEVRGYASNYASRLFRNEGARIEAVDKAMDKFVDCVMNDPNLKLPYARAIVRNSLINIFRAVPVNKNKNLKARLSQIPGRANEIMTLYSGGMRQVDITRKLGVSKQYVSEVVIRWTI